MVQYENIWAVVKGKVGEEHEELREYNVKQTNDGSVVTSWIVSTDNQVSLHS